MEGEKKEEPVIDAETVATLVTIVCCASVGVPVGPSGSAGFGIDVSPLRPALHTEEVLTHVNPTEVTGGGKGEQTLGSARSYQTSQPNSAMAQLMTFTETFAATAATPRSGSAMAQPSGMAQPMTFTERLAECLLQDDTRHRTAQSTTGHHPEWPMTVRGEWRPMTRRWYRFGSEESHVELLINKISAHLAFYQEGKCIFPGCNKSMPGCGIDKYYNEHFDCDHKSDFLGRGGWTNPEFKKPEVDFEDHNVNLGKLYGIFDVLYKSPNQNNGIRCKCDETYQSWTRFRRHCWTHFSTRSVHKSQICRILGCEKSVALGALTAHVKKEHGIDPGNLTHMDLSWATAILDQVVSEPEYTQAQMLEGSLCNALEPHATEKNREWLLATRRAIRRLFLKNSHCLWCHQEVTPTDFQEHFANHHQGQFDASQVIYYPEFQKYAVQCKNVEVKVIEYGACMNQLAAFLKEHELTPFNYWSQICDFVGCDKQSMDVAEIKAHVADEHRCVDTAIDLRWAKTILDNSSTSSPSDTLTRLIDASSVACRRREDGQRSMAEAAKQITERSKSRSRGAESGRAATRHRQGPYDRRHSTATTTS